MSPQLQYNRNMVTRVRNLRVVTAALLIGLLLLGAAASLPALAGAQSKKEKRPGRHQSGEVAASPTTVAPVVPTTAPAPTTTAPPPVVVAPTTVPPVAPPPPSPTPVPAVTYGPSTLALPLYTGPKRITTATALSNVTINGELEIVAPVTMTNVNVNCTTGWACIRVHGGGSLDISSFRIDGGGVRSAQNSGGLVGDNIVARRGEIFGVENGVVGGSNHLVEDVYIHGLQRIFRNSLNPGHPDGVQYDGGNTNITLRRVRIEGVSSDTSAMMFNTEFGPITGLRVIDCQVSGAGVLMYLETRQSGRSIQASVTGTRFASPGYPGLFVWNTNPRNVLLTQANNTAEGRPITF